MCRIDSATLCSQNACDYVAAPIFAKSAPEVEQRTENLVSQAAILNRCCAESACILQVLLAESACWKQATWLQSNQGTLVRFRLWALFYCMKIGHRSNSFSGLIFFILNVFGEEFTLNIRFAFFSS